MLHDGRAILLPFFSAPHHFSNNPRAVDGPIPLPAASTVDISCGQSGEAEAFMPGP